MLLDCCWCITLCCLAICLPTSKAIGSVFIHPFATPWVAGEKASVDWFAYDLDGLPAALSWSSSAGESHHIASTIYGSHYAFLLPVTVAGASETTITVHIQVSTGSTNFTDSRICTVYPSIRVQFAYPLGGTYWRAGSQVTIAWTTSHAAYNSVNLTVHRSTSSGSDFKLVEASVVGSQWMWDVPQSIAHLTLRVELMVLAAPDIAILNVVSESFKVIRFN